MSLMSMRLGGLLIFLLAIELAKAQPPTRYSIEIAAGVRQENLNWSIAGNARGQNPTVFSELIWSKLFGPYVSVRINANIWRNVAMLADFSIMRIVNGTANDTDYNGDDRTDKQFSVDLNSDRGHSFSYAALAGYRFPIGNKVLLTPSIGYSERYQRLFLLDDAALESTYQTKWYGPATNLTVSGRFDKWAFTLSVSYEQHQYRAKADWNLIDAFAHPISFEHRAKGYHFKWSNKLLWLPQQRVSPLLLFDYELARTGTGIDALYFAEGGMRFTQLNGVKRSAIAIGLGVAVSF